jgi:glutathione-specific gamma-glutamylcyclotransferase
MLETTLKQWGGRGDLWIFAYASLIWRPDIEFAEKRFATVHGYHRALKMWSRINRGTVETPGLVFALLAGGSCKGVAFRIEQNRVADTLPELWKREMPNGVYDPKWLRCQLQTPGELAGPEEVCALTFTLSKRSPNFTGQLSESVYARIFAEARGRFGTTRDYAQTTYDQLRDIGIEDRALGKLLAAVSDS